MPLTSETKARVALNCIETFYAVLGDMQHAHSMGGPAFTTEDVLNRASQSIRAAIGMPDTWPWQDDDDYSDD